ncbi:MAG: hypothetical protein SGJ05_08375 [bacterium]|nr:hypothetical protein [bacterium]
MSWKSVIGQRGVKRMLQRAILQKRLPQAILMTGQEGAGTAALAIAFARVVNCEQPLTGEDMIDACGVCHACVQNQGLQHPNVTVVTALPAGKGDADEDMKTEVFDALRLQLREMADDPYDEAQLAGATQIRIGQIRRLKQSLMLSASQNGHRVVLILRADEMTHEASNAFLKTLEEPHDGITIILTTSKPARILPTIASRCQEIICPPLEDADIVEELVRRNDCSESEARLIAPFAQGSLTRARAFLSEDMNAAREEAVNMLRIALRGRDYRVPLVEAAADVADGRDKVRLETMLSLLALWLRDARNVSVSGDDAAIVNGDQLEPLTRFAQGFGGADFNAALTIIELAARDIHRNVHPQLVLVTSMLALRRVFLTARVATV